MEKYNKIDLQGLQDLKKKSRESKNPKKTLTCRTVAVDKFRHENYIRNLPAYIVDEPPVLLGDDTAPNPSEALLAAMGSCIAVGIQANLVDRNIDFRKIELKLEADIDISSVWGTGEYKGKTIGFTEVRVEADIDSDLDEDETKKLVAHVLSCSPVTGTVRNPVAVKAVDNMKKPYWNHPGSRIEFSGKRIPRKKSSPGWRIEFSGKRIFKLRQDNPRREGTYGWRSWELIENGMSFEKYKAKGGRNNDLRWDVDYGYCKVR